MSFTLEFLFVAKWVSDQWRAWAISVSQCGEIDVARRRCEMAKRECQTERERERDGLQTKRPRETNGGGERKIELNKAQQFIAFLSVPSHI